MRMAAGLQFSSRLFPRSSHGFRIGLRKHIPGDRTGPNPARGRLSASRAALRCNRIQLDARRNRANQPGFLFFTTVSASTNSERRVRCEGEWPTYPSPRKIRMSKNLEVTIFKTKDLRAAKMLLVATLADATMFTRSDRRVKVGRHKRHRRVVENIAVRREKTQ